MSSVTDLVFLVNKQTRVVQYAGDVPEAYNGMTGLKDIDYSVLKELHPVFRESESDPRFLHLGFLTEADALAAGVAPDVIATFKKGAWEIKWSSLKDERENLILDQRWRVERYNDEIALGRIPSEDIMPVLEYLQALRDLPVINPDPYNIVWPTIPPVPGE